MARVVWKLLSARWGDRAAAHVKSKFLSLPLFHSVQRRVVSSLQAHDTIGGNPMTLYNTLTEAYEAILPEQTADSLKDPNGKPKGLAWYTCGPTTYAPAHLGHARTYVCLDIIRRVMTAKHQSANPSVPAPLFVLNITDVDDKILAASKEVQVATGAPESSPVALARRYEQEFWRDWDALNCLRPHLVTRVTDHVESHIIPFIKWIVDKHMAYETDDGVYFDVRAYNEQLGGITKYGKLAPPSAAVDLDFSFAHSQTLEVSKLKKKDPRDFVLWKKRKPDELLVWESPWGTGRPGWHIECSAMIHAIQERVFDTHKFHVHAGGIDLKFPHHTNEIAQSEAFFGTGNWIPHWVHTGHLHIDGLKMSKSLKNFVTIQEFLKINDNENGLSMESPSDDFRLWCLGLSGSYRGPATFSEERIQEARAVRQKILRFLMDGEAWVTQNEEMACSSSHSRKWENIDYVVFEKVQAAKRRALVALETDLDGSTFLLELMAMVDSSTAYINNTERGPSEVMVSSLQNIRDMLRLVGFTSLTVDVGLETKRGSTTEDAITPVIDALVNFRSTIRRIALQHLHDENGVPLDDLKDIMKISDDLRDSTLPTIGIQIDDGSDTTGADTWKRCLPRQLASDTDKRQNPNEAPASTIDVYSIPLTDFFKVGQYEGLFSQFTKDGVPTHNTDGSEVSKRWLKKLLKKRDAHKARLEAKELLR